MWTFAVDLRTSDPERVDRILSWRSFDEIAGEIIDSSKVQEGSVVAEPRKRGDQALRRLSFRIDADPQAVDAFFNSPVGYRGQYARSMDKGESANRCLVDAIGDRHRQALVDKVSIATKSLAAEQAKVWMWQDVRVTRAIKGQGPSPPTVEILYAPWMDRLDVWVETSNGERQPARGGVLATSSRGVLEVMGGWLDPSGQLWIDPGKSDRAMQLCKFGFS
jgi:hypothetical protein